MWQVEFSQEAANYAIDSHPYNEEVLIAIEQLALNESGLPEIGTLQTIEDWCIWEIAEHTVVYERSEETLYIWVIRPAE